jgi:hypothetical protein
MPIIGTIASSYLAAIPLGYTSLATTTLGSQSSQIDFNGIPSGYTHLQLRLLLRLNQAVTSQNFQIQFNDDTGPNYNWQRVYGAGGGVTCTADYENGSSWIQADRTTGTSATSNCFGMSVTDILDYSASKFKVTRTVAGYDDGPGGYAMYESGSWLNTSVISKISIKNANGFLALSTFALYGIKAAS